jgi:hypothetical protein
MVNKRLISTSPGIELPYVTADFPVASSITSSSMTLHGVLQDLGGGNVTSHGFYFGTNANYLNNTKIDLGAKATTGNFSTTRTGLNASTTYYIRAFAANEAGEFVGSGYARATSAPTSAQLVQLNFSVITSNPTPPTGQQGYWTPSSTQYSTYAVSGTGNFGCVNNTSTNLTAIGYAYNTHNGNFNLYGRQTVSCPANTTTSFGGVSFAFSGSSAFGSGSHSYLYYKITGIPGASDGGVVTRTIALIAWQ